MPSLALALFTLAPFAPFAPVAQDTHELRTRPTDFLVRRGPSQPELVVTHALPGYISVRPVEPAGTWPTQRLSLDPAVSHYASHVSVRSTDLDGDGDEDLIVLRRRSIGGSLPGDTTVFVFWETGRDPYGAPIFRREAMGGPGLPTEFEVADLDGDGADDLVVASAAHQLFVQSGTGSLGVGAPTFGSYASIGSSLVFPQDLHVVDLDSDGRQDVLVSSRHAISAGVWVHWNDSTPGALRFTSELVTDELPSSTVVADFDGDGQVELAVARGGQTTLVYTAGVPAPGGRFLPPTEVTVLHGAVRALARDLDLDGRLDYVSTDVMGSRIQTAHGVGWPNIARGPVLDVSRATLLRSFDADGDGVPEVWFTSETSQEIGVWRP